MTDAECEATLHQNFTRFTTLVGLAEEYFAAGDPAAAAAFAQIAGRCAFPDFSGTFASPRLERLLLRLAREIPSPAPKLLWSPGGPRRVLHVLTYARPVGGDCRFVWRWMLEDRSSQHSVAVVSQSHYRGVFEIPEFLKAGAEASGGRLTALSASASRPLAQALELRGLCQEVDVVALHLWPHDIVPVLALGSGCDSAKTVFVGHSDHTFWMGGSVSHSIAHLRSQDERFLRERRALVPERSTILPIPLAHRPVAAPATEAKRQLGFAPDAVVLMTVASAFKFSAPGQLKFLDLITPVLQRNPQAAVVAIGPKDEGDWKAAKAATGGRITALGPRWGNDLYYAAADGYLDSVPVSSITSLLEAGSQGIPVLGLKPAPEMALLGPGAPGIEDAMELPGTAEGYQERLERLIRDGEFRAARGKALQAQILSLHTGEGWLRALSDTYAQLERTAARGCLQEESDQFRSGALDRAVARLYEHAYERDHVYRLIRNYIGALPYGSRISATHRLRLAGLETSLLNFLPPPMNALVRTLGRSGKRVVSRASHWLAKRSQQGSQ